MCSKSVDGGWGQTRFPTVILDGPDLVCSMHAALRRGQPEWCSNFQVFKGSLVSTWRWEFEEALHRIDAYLSQGVPEGVVGSQYSLAPGNNHSSCHFNSTYPCPTGWRSTPHRVSITRLSLRTLITVMLSCFALKPGCGSSAYMWEP